METRRKRQEREAEEELMRNPNYRRWANLPDLALSSISDHLRSIPDLSSFSAVCRSYRSLPHSPAVPRPPLFLRSFLPSNRRFSPARPRHTRCRFQSIVPTDTTRSFRSKIHHKTLTSTCLGLSYGHLIVDVGPTCVLADIITGKETNACVDRYAYRTASGSVIAVLTAPPPPSAAQPCWLVMSSPRGTMFWKVGTYEYVMREDLRYGSQVVSLAVMGDKVFSLGEHFRLYVINLTPKISWRRLDVPPPDHSHDASIDGMFNPLLEPRRRFNAHVADETHSKATRENSHDLKLFRVYQLDLTEKRWAAKEGGVGDWCFFVDAMGQRSLACRDPTSWGGRSNSVYVAGPLIDTWSVFPLDGSEFNVTNSPLEEVFASFERWPSPVWFYPSKFFKE